jgi:hypothetical protein
MTTYGDYTSVERSIAVDVNKDNLAPILTEEGELA